MKILILLCLSLTCDLFSQGISYTRQDQFPVEPAFEKIYVHPHQLVNMPDGLYYYDDYGCSTKVKTVLGDENGTYLVMVKYQCPICGRTHANATPDEGYGCPIFMKQVLPAIWCK